MPEPIILSASGSLVPEDRDWWTTPEMINPRYHRPSFITREVTHCFFGRSTVWLKNLLYARFGTSELDDVNADIAPPRTPAGHRRWRLYDIERLARYLLEIEGIDPGQFGLTIGVLKRVAVMHGYDVGDKHLWRLWRLDDLSRREQALEMTRQRMDDDLVNQASGLPLDVDHLVARAAWAVRELEDHLRSTHG